MRAGISQVDGLRFIGNDEINAGQKRLDAPVLLGLINDLDKKWWQAKNAKERVQRQLLKSLRQRLGVYEPEILDDIRKGGGSEIYMMLTNVKCRAAAAWLRDMMLPPTEPLFEIKPTPIPDLPPELDDRAVDHVTKLAMAEFAQNGQLDQEQLENLMFDLRDKLMTRVKELAQESSERMGVKIKDQLAEGDWTNAVAEFVDDLVTYKNAFIKGPYPLKKKKIMWGNLSNGYKVTVKDVVTQWFSRVSPFDMYPSPSARKINQGYLFERVTLSVPDLNEMKGVPGYDDAAIDAVIDEYGSGGLREWLSLDNERARLESRETEFLQANETIDALNFWGNINGDLLKQWDPHGRFIQGEIDVHKAYPVEVWKIGRWIIKAQLNDHPLGERPYTTTSFVKIPGSFWGQSVPELIADDQDMCNGAARSLDNNMGIASGPQVVINDIDRLPAGEPIVSMYPWKIWQFNADTNPSGTNRPAMDFFQPNPLVNELLTVYEKFSLSADDHASLPSYLYGGTTGQKGAAETASGLSMLMGNANKNMKLVVSNVDIDVTEPVVKKCYLHNMLHDLDDSIKGDNSIQARGARSLMAKEQKQMRLNEFMNITNNPIDAQILGNEGRAFLLKEAAKDMIDGEIPGLGGEVAPPPPDPLQQQRLQVEQEKTQAQQATAANEAQKLKIEGGKAAADAQAKIDDRDLKKLIESEKRTTEIKLEQMRLDADVAARQAQENADMIAKLDEESKAEQEKADKAAVETKQAKEKEEKETSEKAEKAHDSEQAQSLGTVASTLKAVSEAMAQILSDQKEQNVQNDKTDQAIVDIAGTIEALKTQTNGQGEQLDEAKAIREKVIAHLAKTGTPSTKTLVNQL